VETFQETLNRLRAGHAVGDEPWRPRWTAGEELSPALRRSWALGNMITAVRLDDTDAWALAGDTVFRLPRAGGEARRLRLAGAGHRRAVFAGDALITADDERVLGWDLATGARRMTTDPDDLPRRAGELSTLAVGGGTAVTGTEAGYLLQWDLTDGRLLARTAAHDDYVSAVAISAGGTVVSIGAGRLRFHTGDGLRPISDVSGVADIMAAGWTTVDGAERAVTVDENGVLNVWDPATASWVTHLHTTTSPRGAPAFLAGGAWAALAEGPALRIVDLRDGTVHATVRTGFGSHVDAVDVRGSFVLAGQGSSTEGHLDLLELTDPLPQDAPDRSHFVDAVATTIDDRPVIVAQEQRGGLQVFDAADGDRLGALGAGVRLDGGYPRLLSDGRLVVLTRLAPTTVDPATGHVRTSAEAPLTPAWLSAAAAGCGLIAAVDLGNTLAVWDSATLALTARAGLRVDATALAITRLDGRPVILAGTDGGGIRWFDATDLHAIDPPGGFAGRGGPDDHEPDGMDWPGPRAVLRLEVLGSTLISAEGDVVRRTDLVTGEPAGPALRHPARVRTIRAADLDGVAVVATGCDDDVVRLWEVDTGRTRWSVPIGQRIFRVLAVTGDQVVLLVRGYFFAVRVGG
jgi:WD40 repeat protein